MNNNLGFYITNFRVTGYNKKPAEITFENGFNLVSGVSDTGKSYIFSCLNYMLGKEANPKSIPESVGYNNFYLGIKTFKGDEYTIYRKLVEKSVKIKKCSVSEYENSKAPIEEYFINNNKKKNLSSFLLKINGIENKFLKKSKSKKVNLIYSYIRNLTLISETRIVEESSPFYPTIQYTENTLYQSLLIYLLTGKDYSDFIPEEEEKIRKSRLSGKLEFVKNRIDTISKNLDTLSTLKSSSKPTFEEDVKLLEEQTLELNTVISDLYKKKSNKFKELEAQKSSRIFYSELIERMELLKKHYNSDLRRLNFIDEGQNLLGQLQTVNCPLCEAEIESEKLQEVEQNIKVKESIDAEKNKIVEKLKDLSSTISVNNQELENISERINKLEIEYHEIDNTIKNEFTPKLNSVKEKLSKINESVSLVSKIELLDKELNFYITEKTNIEVKISLKPVPQTPENIDNKIIDDLCKEIKNILKEWNYPNSDSVVFDSSRKVFDFVISGKARSAYGKGMRAVSYSAVLLGLMSYCNKKSIPFTKSLIIDSPLTTYHGKEIEKQEDGIDINIEHAFFKYFAHKEMDFQFIMFDNKVPASNLIDRFNFIDFSGQEGVGRTGFFPTT